MDFHAESRKVNKPLTERRRRERINNNLSQLKSLVLRATDRQDSVKMEKADILEMTIRYIEEVQTKQLTNDSDMTQLAASSFLQGYSKCANEVASTSVGTSSTNCNDILSSLYSRLSTRYVAMTTELSSQQRSNSQMLQPSLSSPDSSFTNGYHLTSTPRPYRPDISHSDAGTSPFHTSPRASRDSVFCCDWPSRGTTPTSLLSQRSPSASSFSSDADDSGNYSSSVWRPW